MYVRADLAWFCITGDTFGAVSDSTYLFCCQFYGKFVALIENPLLALEQDIDPHSTCNGRQSCRVGVFVLQYLK